MNAANYDEIANIPTIVGTSGRPSHYGTYDQCGNVYEWTEGRGPDLDGGTRTVQARGGRYVGRNGDLGLRADYVHYFPPEQQTLAVGFRLCSHGIRGVTNNGISGRNPLADPMRWSQFVLVGDAGNKPDTLQPVMKNGEPEVNPTPIGAVPYDYLIQRCPVTVEEYCEFLRAVAIEDTHQLYAPGSTSGVDATIEVGEPSIWSLVAGRTYRPMAGKSRKPITRVSWYDACRLANWLSNGKPTGQQTPETTEDGAYRIDGHAHDIVRNTVNPNTGLPPTYWLASPDEWHKAAYYKGGGIDAGYWTYATQSDTPPLAINCDADQNGLAHQPLPYHRHDVRDIAGSEGKSGTVSMFDTAGNVVSLTFRDGLLVERVSTPG